MPSPGTSKSKSRPEAPDKRGVHQESLPLIQVGLGLFLLSAASLAFEVVLTHLYSLVFQYHFAFLAISTAILGLGIGAALGYRSGRTSSAAWLSRTAGLFALALPGVILLFVLTGLLPGLVWQMILGAL